MSEPAAPLRPRRKLSDSSARAVRAAALCLPLVFLPLLLRSPTRTSRPLPSCTNEISADADGRVDCFAGGSTVSAARSLLFGVRPDLNQVDAEDLALVPGIGPTLAARIVDHRRALGAFRNLEDVDRVKGIGPVLLSRLRAYFRVASPVLDDTKLDEVRSGR
ncbi:MAG: helix-hairpin-helix domain-containing protein [Deltaproteobacteria bacterium]|nr:helix-hairpin-helix domain-containing protein [Deltaproteobacteria bacterium]